MTQTDTLPTPLLTPAEAAQRLLEEAALQAYRSKGREGLVAVKDGRRRMYRPQDVEAFLQRLQAA